MDLLRCIRPLSFVVVLTGMAVLGCEMVEEPSIAHGTEGAGVSSGPPFCHDGVRNGGETDVDCGGPCGPCPDGRACRNDRDCINDCVDGVCRGPACDDGVRNGDETDVDCGGSCSPCPVGSACRSHIDCVTWTCAEGVCVRPSCTDGVWNGTETDVDCGGDCPPCRATRRCRVDDDCASGICDGGRCAAPSCTDGVRNGTETDVDCGGDCPPCRATRSCRVDGDCASGICQDGTCAFPSCSDGVRNGTETDVDCGGSCGPCADGQGCQVDDDCTSLVCDAGTCAAPQCGDGVVNQPSEECDEGPTGGDGCSPTCEIVGCPPDGVRLIRDGRPVCAWMPSPVSVEKEQARAACQDLGPDWSLCTAAVLCEPDVVAMLGQWGCACGGDPSACGGEIPVNVYVHVEDLRSPHLAYWIRQAAVPGCAADTSCAASTFETFGAPLCCLGMGP